MNTPIADFINEYAQRKTLRLHMPGHKGVGDIEQKDITEITGADSLYEANGIILESEKNASELFQADTFYSTEGSSHCIRAMLYLTTLYAKKTGKKPFVLAGRNAHKTFLSAVALLDIDVEWLYQEGNYLSCNVTAESVEKAIKNAQEPPVAVYLTSPDYLGNMLDISAIKTVCEKYGALLLIDNAHGGYLKFLEKSLFPIDLGADMVATSAHKTLPVLTGGAYLQIAKTADCLCKENAKTALALFGSTSPSYLILSSLDRANEYLDKNGREFSYFAGQVEKLKNRLQEYGYSLLKNEPLKITLQTKEYGYTGKEVAEFLQKKEIVCEFYDDDFLVLMLTPNVGEKGLKTLEHALLSLPKKEKILPTELPSVRAEKKMSIRQATLLLAEELPVESCVGRVLAKSNLACPPAVPIVVCGEEIDETAVKVMQYYKIDTCWVLK